MYEWESFDLCGISFLLRAYTFILYVVIIKRIKYRWSTKHIHGWLFFYSFSEYKRMYQMFIVSLFSSIQKKNKNNILFPPVELHARSIYIVYIGRSDKHSILMWHRKYIFCRECCQLLRNIWYQVKPSAKPDPDQWDKHFQYRIMFEWLASENLSWEIQYHLFDNKFIFSIAVEHL